MKSKFLAVVIIALLALSVVPAFSFDPDPEEPPFVKYIDPQKINFTGPCTESQRFTAEDMVYKVEDLYAWDIIVVWDPTYLALESYTINIPAGWPVDGYQILINETEDVDDPGWLHYAVTRLGNVSGFSGTMSLLTMEFHVIYEPCYMEDCIETHIYNDFYNFSGPCGYGIEPDQVEESIVWLNPSRPNMEILLTDEWPEEVPEVKKTQGWYEDQVITMYVWVSNVTKLYGISAKVIWDPDLLRIDLQQITINEEAFPQPWTYLYQHLGEGSFDFDIWRPCEKPPLKGTFWILKMDFKVKCVVDEVFEIPTPDWCEVYLAPAYSGLCMCGDWYDWPDWLDLSYIEYYWTPIPYDFNQNGHVGVEDILIALDHYGDDYDTTITDDNTNFGSRDNEAVAATWIPSGLTLDALFAGGGFSYTYTVIDGGLWAGASPVMAVIDLADGRHIILYPGWGGRTGTHTLTFSDTVAADTGGNNLVDFTIYAPDFSGGAQWSSCAEYGNWNYLKASGSSTGGALPLTGTEVVTRIAIQHQAANTGETDRVDSMTICSTTYDFPFEGFDFDGDLDVDIFDIVIVAKHYCNDTPPEIPDP